MNPCALVVPLRNFSTAKTRLSESMSGSDRTTLARVCAEGVIEHDVSIVSPKAAGRPLSMVVMVSLERERADIVDRFKQSIRSTPEVMTGYYVTGDADFILIVTAQSMEDYEAFTRRFFYENPDIKGFKTQVVMDRVKVGFAIPVVETT